MRQPRGADGRFGSVYDPVELLALTISAIRAIADEPLAVTRPRFDRERPRTPALPSAAQVCRRLNTSWQAIQLLARDSTCNPEHTIGKWLGQSDLSPQRRQHALMVLRAVALRSSEESPSPASYRSGREQLLRGDRAAWRHGRRLFLPSALQLERLGEGWDQALAGADLARRPQATSIAGVPIVDALELFASCYGAVPGTRTLELFARGRFALAKRRRPWREYLAELALRFEATGRELPRFLDPGECVDLDTPAALAAIPETWPKNRSKRRNREEAVSALLEFLDWLGPKRCAGQREHASFGKSRPGVLSVSAIQRAGGWSKLLDEARARRGALRRTEVGE
jgi:hypothetical protein